MSTPKSQTDRRTFIKTAGATAALTGVVAAPAVSFGYHNSVKDVLKVGLVGCGGRGTGAAINAMNADPSTKVVALADAFMDRIDKCEEILDKQIGDRLELEPANKFDGLDCHEKLCAADVDVVLLATPPHFRPAQMRAAVNAGKHVFCEKPVGVDVPGVLSVLETCKLAAKKGLSVVSGLCWRYDIGVNAIMDQIKDGAIGEIQTIQENYLTGTLWHRGEDPNWSPMEYQLRNWLYFNWLAGDHIAEQHIHSLDKALWLMGDSPPVSAYGTGGRQVRTNEKWGNVYDHFNTVFEWENGVKCFSSCRQMAGCHNDVEDYVVGTKGTAEILRFRINGKAVFKGKKPSMYDVEHQHLFKSIRDGKPINNGHYMCNSTLMALIGRDVSYTGKKIKWADYLKSEDRLGPCSIHVQVSEEKMNRNELSMDEIVKLIRKSHERSGGHNPLNIDQQSVVINAPVLSRADLADMTIKDDGDKVITLGDVAEFELGDLKYEFGEFKPRDVAKPGQSW